MSPDEAYGIAYPVVPVVLLAMLLPLLRRHAEPGRLLLHFRGVRPRLLVAAFALGLLLRILWWSQLVVRISFGLTGGAMEAAGPAFSFGCPRVFALMSSLVVMAIFVPVTEEVLHRGIIQSAFAHRGPWVAIILSATTFAIAHDSTAIALALLAGIVFGVLFWNTGVLWYPITAHATYNGVSQLDWLCLRGTWAPSQQSIPLLTPGLVSICVGALAAALVVAILWYARPGRAMRPDSAD